MATATFPSSLRKFAPTTRGESRIFLHDVPWSGYEAVLRWVGDRPLRVTYDRGNLEIMSPSSPHEELRKLLGWLVEIFLEEHDIPSRSLGSMTFKRKDLERGLEPDDCYYIAKFEQVRGRRRIRLEIDPPPDLVIEVDISSSSRERLEIYAALGVAEVLIYRDGKVEFLRPNRQGVYSSRRASQALPGCTPGALTEWINRGFGGNHSAWRKAFRKWVRGELAGS